jgi:hypothetical protein
MKEGETTNIQKYCPLPNVKQPQERTKEQRRKKEEMNQIRL